MGLIYPIGLFAVLGKNTQSVLECNPHRVDLNSNAWLTFITKKLTLNIHRLYTQRIKNQILPLKATAAGALRNALLFTMLSC
jgi:hypothetical protein